METTIYIPTPKTPTHATSRDDRLRIQTLYYTAGWSIDDILLQNPRITHRQIQYALEHRPTPQKHYTGRHVLLDTPHRKFLIKWVTQSSFTREIPWAELPKWLEWDEWCGGFAIRRAFKTEGYCRGVRRRKPPLSEANRIKRLNWALEHLNWTDEQWDEILWSDESWVQPGYHKRQWCTRKIGLSELFIPDCISHKWQRKIGWMFWGCISGKYGKGAGLFWEKAWKTITKETYCKHTFLVLWNYLYSSDNPHPGLSFQQDGGPGHNAEYSLEYMRARGVIPIFWPPFSPDLSPIESIWDRMKDILQALHPEVHQNSQRLREAVLEAWNMITDGEIRELIHTMHQRCLDVINANGMYTKW